MSVNGSRKIRNATRDAISAGRLEELLNLRPAVPIAAPEQPQLSAAEKARQEAIERVARDNKLNKGSAEILQGNPWLQPYLEQAKQAGAKVTQIDDYCRTIVLTIKTPKDKHDVAKIEVTEQGEATVYKEPKGEILQQLANEMAPPKPRRSEGRASGYVRPWELDF